VLNTIAGNYEPVARHGAGGLFGYKDVQGTKQAAARPAGPPPSESASPSAMSKAPGSAPYEGAKVQVQSNGKGQRPPPAIGTQGTRDTSRSLPRSPPDQLGRCR